MDANELVKRCIPLLDDAIKVKSIVIDSKLVCGTSRPRRYWTNLSVTQPSPSKSDPRRCLSPGWLPLWEFPSGQPRPDVHFGTFTRGFAAGLPFEVPSEFKTFARYPLHAYHDRLMVYLQSTTPQVQRVIADWVRSAIRIKTDDIRDKDGVSLKARGRLAKFIHVDGGHRFLRPLSCLERERLMGFPEGASALPEDELLGDFFNLDQSRAIGNAFNVHVIKHLLMPYASFVNGHATASQAVSSSWSFSSLPSECDFESVLRSVQPPPLGGRSR